MRSFSAETTSFTTNAVAPIDVEVTAAHAIGSKIDAWDHFAWDTIVETTQFANEYTANVPTGQKRHSSVEVLRHDIEHLSARIYTWNAGSGFHAGRCSTRMNRGSKCFACTALKKHAIMKGSNTSATGSNTNISGAIASIKNGDSKTIITPVIVNLNRFMRRARLADLLMGERTFADVS